MCRGRGAAAASRSPARCSPSGGSTVPASGYTPRASSARGRWAASRCRPAATRSAGCSTIGAATTPSAGRLQEKTVALSAFGTAQASLVVPSRRAGLGTYEVAVELRREGKWTEIASAWYRVAEYRPPEFLVDVVGRLRRAVRGRLGRRYGRCPLPLRRADGPRRRELDHAPAERRRRPEHPGRRQLRDRRYRVVVGGDGRLDHAGAGDRERYRHARRRRPPRPPGAARTDSRRAAPASRRSRRRSGTSIGRR